MIYGGIHATLYPEEAIRTRMAACVVNGDGDQIWGKVVSDCVAGTPSGFTKAARSRETSLLRPAGT